MTNQVFTLPTGRRLGYALYGPESGKPVLYFHGTPSSRLEPGLLRGYGTNPEQVLTANGLQLIAVDRPGMGLSDFNPNGSFRSFANDAATLLHARNITQCPVLCWSGGGPFALAIAAQFPQTISAVYILCGFTTRFTADIMERMFANKWYFRTARYTPWLLEVVLNRLRNHYPRRPIPQKLTGLPDADYELLNTPALLQNMSVHSLSEACRNGARGPVYDAAIYFREFGFALSDIRQPVHYWWGTEDRQVIRKHPDALAQQVPNVHFHLKKGEGHASLYVRHFTEAVQTIAAAYPDPVT